MRFRWLLGGAGALLLLFAALWFLPLDSGWAEWSSHSYCSVCRTTRTLFERSQDGVVVGGSVKVAPSRLFRDLLGDAHGHTWVFEHYTKETATSCAVGCGKWTPPNRFVRGYQYDVGFRRLVSSCLADGTITRDGIERIAALEDFDGTSPAAQQGRALCEDYFGTSR